MCGIICALKNTSGPEGLQKAFQVIRHRGPDHSGIFEDALVFLGNHRLKVRDLSDKANQPLSDPSGRYHLIYNGEIYNHFALRKKLASTGIQFQTHSDTETLLYAYIHFGRSVLSLLNGIFAFIVYDSEAHTLFGARDMFGAKPLYLYQKGALFACSSEIKSFLYLDHFNFDVDHRALTGYMQYLWSPGDQTPFTHVQRCAPGSWFELQIGSPDHKMRTGNFATEIFDGSREFYSKHLWTRTMEETLTSIMGPQLEADVPSGFLLSGGINSSLLVQATRNLLPETPLHCFTMHYSDDASSDGFNNDLYYARIAAKHARAELHIIDGHFSLLDDLDDMIWHLDEPQSDTAPLYVYQVSKAARAMDIPVLISGTGGDDLFSGYRRHQAAYYDHLLKIFPKFSIELMEKWLRKRDQNNPTVRRMLKLFRNHNTDPVNRLAGFFEWFPIMQYGHLFTPEVQDKIATYDPAQSMYAILRENTDPSDLHKMLALETKTFLPNHNLNYIDKMSMACGVEIRVPYLDTHIVDLAAHLPTSLKMRKGKTKYILREIGKKMLPHEIVTRKKTGFGGPLRQWMQGEFPAAMQRTLEPDRIRAHGVFQPGEVMKLIEDNKKGKIDAGYTILSILAIESWLHQFTDKEGIRDHA